MDITDEMEYLNHVQQKIQDFGINYPTRLLYAFHTALKSATYAPLSVLSGVSGTGKSELPKLYAHFGGFNFLAQAVQPTWDSPESMMGYFNMIENKFDSTEILRFFVQTAHSQREQDFGLQESMNLILLDEMNLAHIELYFAEFLSKLEQKRSDKEGVFVHVKLGTGMPWQVPLGDNLLWVGTMNEDESTKALSDKVLDRAFCLNFPRPAKLHSRKTGLSITRQDFKYLRRSTWQTWLRDEEIPAQALENYKELVQDINKLLEQTGRAIGHRVWQGMEFYMKNHPLVFLHKEDSTLLDQALRFAFEEQVVQKIVPKLRGMEIEGDTHQVLVDIQELLTGQKLQLGADFQHAMNNPYRQFIFNSAHYLDDPEWQTLLNKAQK
ncbi:McrB family protein [Helicobacter felis]|uniref:McrB family protein n=1 Tax=Helicobacter felis TaxID=214 RepID=UPI001F468E61|nr:restriction endonuclease [Helicobacter felis]